MSVAGGEVFALFGQEAIQVVVIDQPYVNLAGRRRRYLGGVLGIDLNIVVQHCAQPFLGARFAPSHAQGGDHRLEGAVSRRPADTSSPLRLGEAPKVVGQVAFGEVVGAVHHYPGPAGDAYPTALFRLRPRRRRRSDVVGEVGHQRGHGGQTARILGVKHVGRRVVAFFKQRGGQRAGVSVLDLHINAGGVLELLDDGGNQRFAAAGIDNQIAGIVIYAGC